MLQFNVVNDTTITATIPVWTGSWVEPHWPYFDIPSDGKIFCCRINVYAPGGKVTNPTAFSVHVPKVITASIHTGANYVGPLSGITLNYALSGTSSYSGTLTLDNSGKGNINALAGTYNLELTGSPWLRRKITNIDASNDTTVNVSLANGDTNGDGQVNLFDFVVLDMNFGSYTPMADLDGDGQVNLFDYTIIDQNFGAQADQ